MALPMLGKTITSATTGRRTYFLSRVLPFSCVPRSRTVLHNCRLLPSIALYIHCILDSSFTVVHFKCPEFEFSLRLCVNGLFNRAVSRSDYIGSNGQMINE
jgi:hypothetical protein